MVQEAIISAYESIHKVKNMDYVKTWFYRILVNKCLAECKQGQRSITSCELLEQTASYDEYHPEIIDLYNAIARLEPQFKTVIILRYFEDMKIAEIAEILKSKESTIKSRINAAVKKIELLVRSEA
jgi:RNA polymerase sigma-70 factor (ECF subfamily)